MPCVRSGHKSLRDIVISRKKRMIVLLRSLNTTQNRGLALAINSTEIQPLCNFIINKAHHYQKLLSLATVEAVIITVILVIQVVRYPIILKHELTQLLVYSTHTTSHEISSVYFLSVFEGYFNCGQKDHRNTRDYASAKAGNFDKQRFFAEIWAYTPHTKRPDFKPFRQSESSRGNNNMM